MPRAALTTRHRLMLVVAATLLCSLRAAAAPSFALVPLLEGQADDAQRVDVLTHADSAAAVLLRSALKDRAATLQRAQHVRGSDAQCRERRDGDACLARIGRDAGATTVLAVGPDVVDGAPVVVCLVLDVASGERRRRVLSARDQAAFDAEALLRRAVLREDKLAGLVVDATPAGARVVVDGVPVGVAPLAAPVSHLLPGEHRVVVEAAAHERVERAVVVGEGVRETVTVALAPVPEAVVEVAASEPKDARRALRVAVYSFELSGVDPALGTVVTDVVVAELRKLQRVSVIGIDEVQAMLDHEAQKQLTGCSDESCLSEIADALGVDALVVGSIAQVGDERVFGMRRIDQREAKVVGQVSQRLVAGSGEELLLAVGPAVEQLFGDHELRDGMTRGVSEQMVLRLNPPPLPPWVFWTGVGSTAVVAVAGGMLSAFSFATLAGYHGLVERGKQAPIQATELRAAAETNNVLVVGAWVTLGGALLLGAATGATALFVDWSGAAEREP